MVSDECLLGFAICNVSQLLNFYSRLIEQIEHVDLFTSFNSLGNHRQRKENNGCTRDLHAGVSTILIFNRAPLNSTMLNERVTKYDSHALQFVSLAWLENILFQ